MTTLLFLSQISQHPKVRPMCKPRNQNKFEGRIMLHDKHLWTCDTISAIISSVGAIIYVLLDGGYFGQFYTRGYKQVDLTLPRV